MTTDRWRRPYVTVNDEARFKQSYHELLTFPLHQQTILLPLTIYSDFIKIQGAGIVDITTKYFNFLLKNAVHKSN